MTYEFDSILFYLEAGMAVMSRELCYAQNELAKKCSPMIYTPKNRKKPNHINEESL
jgi:hypothetical protein